MEKALLQFIQEQKLIQPNQKVLIALSAGVDSVVLCHLFKKTGLAFAIAHVNFQLRGAASDGDEQFAKALARQLAVQAFTTTLNTVEYAQQEKLSIQLAARQFRYQWLEAIRQEHHFDWIATAHHLNDAVETLIFNLTKGTGIKGLHGIPVKNGRIIRPLLFATKQKIVNYAEEHQYSFREDHSNASDKYDRNKIRHHVLPVLKDINPDLEQTMAKNIRRFQGIEQWYFWAVEQMFHKIVKKSNSTWYIDWPELQKLPAHRTLLFEWLRDFGFHEDQIQQITQSAPRQAGAIFYTPSHQLLVDRQQFIVRAKPKTNTSSYLIPLGTTELHLDNAKFSIEKIVGQPTQWPDSEWMAYLDVQKMEFPLTLRHWREGDAFQPLGMQGKHQKLQDFFTHQKLNRFEKEKIWILETNDGNICWVVGYRIADNYKLSAKTESYWTFNFENIS